MGDVTNSSTVNATLWSAADKGDTVTVKELLALGRDVNSRNCLGCTPLLYACGSGHLETVKTLLEHPNIDVNRKNNDRLTSFMLAMQGGPLIGHLEASWPGWGSDANAREKMRHLMDLPATDDLEWGHHDRWTALMDASNFGHKAIVEVLLKVPSVDLDAVNLRGQKADDVASSRGHDGLAALIKAKRLAREQPEELPRIRQLEEEVEALKTETRQRLLTAIDVKHEKLADLKASHEAEIETLTRQIDNLQDQLEEAMKARLSMITRQVREVKRTEEDIRHMKRQLDNFDRYSSASTVSLGGSEAARAVPINMSTPELAMFDKDFECSVCLDDMRPPLKIFQCRNGHVLCETCKNHPEVTSCPSCRIPLAGTNALMRNIPMEKLAKSYYDRLEAIVRQQQHLLSNSLSRTTTSRRGSLGNNRDNLINNRRRLNAGGLSCSSSDTAVFLDW